VITSFQAQRIAALVDAVLYAKYCGRGLLAFLADVNHDYMAAQKARPSIIFALLDWNYSEHQRLNQ